MNQPSSHKTQDSNASQLDMNPLDFHNALKNQAKQAETFSMMAMVQLQQGNLQTALKLLNQASTFNPSNGKIWQQKGSVLLRLGQISEAMACLEKAVKLSPTHKEMILDTATTAKSNKYFSLAALCYENLTKLEPENISYYYELIHSYFSLGDFEAALKACDLTLKIAQNSEYVWYIKALCLQNLNQYAEAVKAYEGLLKINPDYPEALALQITCMTKIADWNNLPELIEQMRDKLDHNIPVSAPFYLLLNGDMPKEQIFCCQSFLQRNGITEKSLGDFHIDYAKQNATRIKIAYVSADYYNHATAVLMAELFELHDKNRFEIYAYSIGPDIDDSWRNRLQNAFEHFYEVSKWSDEAIARHIHEQQISIVIDLKGYTADSRAGIFAYRPAPIQVNYIGYPGTMGASFIDYILADNVIIPPQLEQFYTEKVIKMPHTYQPNDRHRPASAKSPSKSEVGLPESAFVFCCFNNPFKILPATFASWMRILKAVPNSVLWLLKDTNEFEDNLRQYAQQAGVDPSRLIFAPRVLIEEHLARQSLADLFLDTLPYNAHTTTSDALWMGLPVLTCMGESFAARVAGSLLTACGLEELITQNTEDYEAVAIELANNPDKLAAIKAKLLNNRDTLPLFDTPRYTKNLEAAYEHIFALALEGKKPETFTVKDINETA